MTASRACSITPTLNDVPAEGLSSPALAWHIRGCASCRSALPSSGRLAVGAIDEAPGALAALERYRIDARIGHGGMGEVFRAYDARLARDVALKVVRGSSEPASSEEGAARLLREAQALAQMSHPNVIAVYDVGTVAGQVFVAMELVDGETLRAWLAREPRSAEAVLAVFLAAGDGLAAAHAAGLVHRDFKPDNVMVGRDGRVRVLDFGLARASAASDAPSDARAPMPTEEQTRARLLRHRTETGALVGTPRYMAPEQWLGEAADARSDQFSFCVALHEALFGEHPLLDGEPAPGAAARRARLFASFRARRDGRLRRALARGLSADPAARYPAMGALLADLRPRLRRFTVAAAALASAALVGTAWGIHAKTLAARECDAAAESFVGTWDGPRRAQLASAFARALGPGDTASFTRFEQAVQRYVDDWGAMHGDACRASRVRHTQSTELMDLRMRCLDRRLDGLRGFLAAVEETRDRKALLGALEDVNKLTPVSLCADAEQLGRAVPLPTDEAARATVLALERRVAEELGSRTGDRWEQKLAAAQTLVRDAEAARHEPVRARALLVRGIAESRTGKTNEAIESFKESALAAGRGRDDRTVAQAWVELAAAHVSQSAYEKALTLEPVAQVAIERIGGALEMQAPLERNMGWALREMERFDDATARYERIIAQTDKDARLAVERARAMNGLAVVRKEQGRYEEAQRLYEQAIAAASAVLGEAHPTVSVFRCNLGVTLESQGKVAEARALFEEARERYADVLGPDHPDRGLPLANLGTLALETGALDEAEASFSEALRVWEKAYGPRELQVGQVRADLGRVSLRRGRIAEAIARLEAALAIVAGSVGEDSAHAADLRASLAEAYLEAGRTADARASASRALSNYRAHGREPHVLARIELTSAEVTARTGGDPREAAALAEEARRRAASAGPDGKDTARRAEAWLARHGR